MLDSFVTSSTVAHQAPLSVGFPRQEYCSGLPFPSPGLSRSHEIFVEQIKANGEPLKNFKCGSCHSNLNSLELMLPFSLVLSFSFFSNYDSTVKVMFSQVSHKKRQFDNALEKTLYMD